MADLAGLLITQSINHSTKPSIDRWMYLLRTVTMTVLVTMTMTRRTGIRIPYTCHPQIVIGNSLRSILFGDFFFKIWTKCKRKKMFQSITIHDNSNKHYLSNVPVMYLFFIFWLLILLFSVLTLVTWKRGKIFLRWYAGITFILPKRF